MPAPEGNKPYDLEERTALFAERVRRFAKVLPRTIANIEDIKQLVRASGSVGANYIEANEALGAKDRLMRMRIAKMRQRNLGTGSACSMPALHRRPKRNGKPCVRKHSS